MPKDLRPVPGGSENPVVETVVRALLGVGLFAAFPPFSDVFRLWNRDLGVGAAFEYPPVVQALWAPLSFLPSATAAVLANGLAMALVAAVIAWMLMREETERGPADTSIWARSLTLIFFLPINWDVVAGLLVLTGVLSAEHRRDVVGGAWFGLGTALKVAPAVALLGVAGAMRDVRRAVTLGTTSVGTIAAVYLAARFANPGGWLEHLQFAAERDDYQSTVWGPILTWLEGTGVHVSVASLNRIALFALVLGLSGVFVWGWVQRPTVAEAAAVGLLVFLLLNKVFKPQYVLWVLPLLALVRVRRDSVRALELAALVEFAHVYWPNPPLVATVAAMVRVGALVLIAAQIVMRDPSSARHPRPAI